LLLDESSVARQGIFRYLQPEFERSYKAESHLSYGFDIPNGCNDQLAQAMYWDIMNRVRAGPLMPQFTISDSLKKR